MGKKYIIKKCVQACCSNDMVNVFIEMSYSWLWSFRFSVCSPGCIVSLQKPWIRLFIWVVVPGLVRVDYHQNKLVFYFFAFLNVSLYRLRNEANPGLTRTAYRHKIHNGEEDFVFWNLTICRKQLSCTPRQTTKRSLFLSFLVINCMMWSGRARYDIPWFINIFITYQTKTGVCARSDRCKKGDYTYTKTKRWPHTHTLLAMYKRIICGAIYKIIFFLVRFAYNLFGQQKNSNGFCPYFVENEFDCTLTHTHTHTLKKC